MSRVLRAALPFVLALAPAGCRDGGENESTSISGGPRSGEAAGEEAEPPEPVASGGGAGAAPDFEEESFDELPEISSERRVLWDSEAPGSSERLVWRPDEESAIALSVRTRGSGASLVADVEASLGGRVPGTVYRCTGLDAETGAQVALQLDGEGVPHILCESRGENDGAGSTFGVRLGWQPERRAVTPLGTWKAQSAGVSPDEALRAARDAGAPKAP